MSGLGHKFPIGQCKVCAAKVAVRRDGTIRRHGEPQIDPFTPGAPCEGSYQKGWALDAEGLRIPKVKADK